MTETTTMKSKGDGKDDGGEFDDVMTLPCSNCCTTGLGLLFLHM